MNKILLIVLGIICVAGLVLAGVYIFKPINQVGILPVLAENKGYSQNVIAQSIANSTEKPYLDEVTGIVYLPKKAS